MWHACNDGNIDITNLLIDAGADVHNTLFALLNKVTTVNLYIQKGWSLLWNAFTKNRIKVAIALVNAGAVVNETNKVMSIVAYF